MAVRGSSVHTPEGDDDGMSQASGRQPGAIGANAINTRGGRSGARMSHAVTPGDIDSPANARDYSPGHVGGDDPDLATGGRMTTKTVPNSDLYSDPLAPGTMSGAGGPRRGRR